jgi:hypothetical protein
MSKKSKMNSCAPMSCEPPPYTAAEQASDYQRSYEFNKPVSARSPVSGWEAKYMNEGYSRVPAKERALVKGNSHSFKGVRTGNSYGSRPAVKRKSK